MTAILNFLDKWKIPKSRVAFHVLFAIVTAGIWLVIAFLIEVYIVHSRENRLWKAQRKRLEAIENQKAQVANKEAIIADLLKVRGEVEESVRSKFSVPFEFPTVWLWESREQRTSVTSGTTYGKTRTGSVGLGWSEGIGWAASQGVTRGTVASTSTETISNEFMQLDSGVLRIGKEFVAFIGNQFSRTGLYKDILAINDDYDKAIGFSILNLERIWLTRFPGEFEKTIAITLIKIALSQANDKKAIKIDDLLDEFQLNIQQLEKEIGEIWGDLNVLIEDEVVVKQKSWNRGTILLLFAISALGSIFVVSNSTEVEPTKSTPNLVSPSPDIRVTPSESPSLTPTPTASPTPETPLEFRFSAIRDLKDLRADVTDARVGISEDGLGKFYWNLVEIQFNMSQLESLLPREAYAERWNTKLEVLKKAVAELDASDEDLTISKAKKQLDAVLKAIPALESIARSLAN